MTTVRSADRCNLYVLLCLDQGERRSRGSRADVNSQSLHGSLRINACVREHVQLRPQERSRGSRADVNSQSLHGSLRINACIHEHVQLRPQARNAVVPRSWKSFHTQLTRHLCFRNIYAHMTDENPMQTTTTTSAY